MKLDIKDTLNIPLKDCHAIIHDNSSKIIVYSTKRTNKVEIYNLLDGSYCSTIYIPDQEIVIHNISCDKDSNLFAIAASAKPMYGNFENPSDSFFIFNIKTCEKVFGRKANMDNSTLQRISYDCDINSKAGLALTAGTDQCVDLYNLKTGDLIQTFNCELNANCMLSPKGDFIVVSGEDPSGSLALIKVDKDAIVNRYVEFPSFISSIDLCMDGSQCLITTETGEIIIFEFAKHKIIASVQAGSGILLDAKFFKDDLYIISVGSNGSLKIWDGKLNEIVEAKIDPSDYSYFSIAHDGKKLLRGDGGKSGIALSKIDWGDKNEVIELSRKKQEQTTGQFNIKLYKEIKSEYGLDYLEVNSDGSRIITAGDSGQVQLWDSQTGNLLYEKAIQNHLQYLGFLNNSPVIVSTGHKILYFIFLENQEKNLTYSLPPSYIHLSSISPDGKCIGVLSDTISNGVVLNRFSSLENEILTTRTHYIDRDLLYDLTPSPGVFKISEDGKRIFLKKKNIIVISTGSGKQVGTLSSHPGTPDFSNKVNSFSFFNNGTRAIVTHGKNIRIWDPNRIETLLLLEREKAKHEESLYVGRERICFWKQNIFESVGELYTASIFENNHIIVCGGEDGYIYIFDIEKKIQLGKIKAHDSWVKTLNISYDGRFLISTGSKGNLKKWKIYS